MEIFWIVILFIIIALIAGTIWFYKLVYNFFIALFTQKGTSGTGGSEEYDMEEYDY